jgi:hypothetical protein
MPAGDGTGPLGYGPMTGRGLGYCAGTPQPGQAVPGWGRGGWGGRRRGRGGWGGWGRRWGWSHWNADGWYPPPYAPVSRDAEREALRQQARMLEQTLEWIHRRIEELEEASGEGEEE